MSNTASAEVELRPLADIFEEAIDTLRQELSEYSFIALVGAVVAGLAVLVCGVIDTPVSLSLIPPLVALSAVLTLATCAAAFGSANNQLQPDAGSAAIAMLRRLPVVLLPWLPLLVGLWIASYALGTFSDYVDKAHIPNTVQVLAIMGIALLYAYPRSLAAAAAFEEQFSGAQAQSISAFVVRHSGRRIQAMWAVVLAPAGLMLGLSLVVGLDTVTGALITCFFVGAMPLAAAMTSLLFYDAASQIELAPSPAATAHRIDPRRA
jgi:hypothetical protein